MINWVKVKTKYADGSLSNEIYYLFPEPDDRYGWIYRNFYGGFCTKECIAIVASGTFSGTKEQFVELHRKEFYSYLIKKNSPYDWLSPLSEWYPCSYTKHQEVAEGYLGLNEEELESRGWIKVHKEFNSDKPVYSQYRASEKQLKWLQNHQVHYSTFACMQ
jgi:hypothetical protein